MARQDLLRAQPPMDSDPPIDPIVLPDVATQLPPILDRLDPPLADDVDAEEDEADEHAPAAPLGDYTREIQQEYDEQEEEGKV